MVVAPSGAGKTTLVDALLRSHAPPEVARAVGLGAAEGLAVSDAIDIHSIEPVLPRLALLYDLTRPWKYDTKTHARDEPLDILDCAARTRVVTLFAEPAQLLERRGPRRESKRAQIALGIYESGPRLVTMYRSWLELLDARRLESIFVDTTGTPRVIARADLEARLAALDTAAPG